MQKFLPLVIVLIFVMMATNGAASQDLLEPDPSITHAENLAKIDVAVPVAENDGTWTNGGPFGGKVTCLAVATSNPDIMYAGSEGQIYKTTDGGATWTWVGLIYAYIGDTPSTTSATLLDLQIAPDNPDVVYAGTESGINISQNGGRDWINTWPGSDIVVNSIAIDPTNPNNILIGTGDTPYQTSTEIIGIFKSVDGGSTWQEKLPRLTPGEEILDAVHTILFDTNNPLTVYAGVQRYTELGGYNGGLRKSTDGGETWSTMMVYAKDDVFALAMTPSGFSPATIYAYAYYLEKDIYASTDQGVTWVPLENPDPAIGVPNVDRPFMVVDPGNAKQFYTSGPDSLYKYDGDTEQWAEIASAVFSIRPRDMVISPQNGDMFIGAYTGGFFQSADGGNQWMPANLINTRINDLAIDPNDSQTAYAVVDGIGFSLAKTNNGGDTWEYLENSETYLNAVAIDPQNPATIYTAKDTTTLQYTGALAFIYKSVNSGQDWEKIPYLRCALDPCKITIQKILVSAADSKYILLAGTGDNGLLGRTTNGGDSWVEIDDDETSALAADPNDPDIVFGGMTWRNGLHRYTDIWDDWSRTTYLPEDGLGRVYDIAVDRGSCYWWTGGGLRRREFQVETTHFTNLPTDSINAVAIDRSVIPNVVYIGTSGMGVYVSKDDGDSWTAMNDGIGSLSVTNLQVSEGYPKFLYAGTSNRGVWSMMIGNGHSISIYLPLVVE